MCVCVCVCVCVRVCVCVCVCVCVWVYVYMRNDFHDNTYLVYAPVLYIVYMQTFLYTCTCTSTYKHVMYINYAR